MNKPNSKRNLDMAIRRMGSTDEDYMRNRTVIANAVVDYTQTRVVCERLFAYRRRHAWPPALSANPGWDTVYAEAAKGLDVARNVADAVAWTNDLVERIVRGGPDR